MLHGGSPVRAYAPEHLQPHRVKLGLVNVTFNGCIYCSIKKKKNFDHKSIKHLADELCKKEITFY